jgi:hypothetical protein
VLGQGDRQCTVKGRRPAYALTGVHEDACLQFYQGTMHGRGQC